MHITASQKSLGLQKLVWDNLLRYLWTVTQWLTTEGLHLECNWRSQADIWQLTPALEKQRNSKYEISHDTSPSHDKAVINYQIFVEIEKVFRSELQVKRLNIRAYSILI